LDVWIDSGSSHAAVLKPLQGATSWPADLYLEGSDQHRGWFQSSLWTGVIAHGGAPYRTVLTHGFIVGKDGKKISKSGQYEKPPTSDNYIAQYGADVIRLWIASQDFTEDIRVSDLGPDLKNPASILNVVGEAYRLLRNTLRYQLSCLHDFDPARDQVPAADLEPFDRWALHKAAELADSVTASYEAYEYHRVYQLLNQFCSVTLSATYHDILKDRLYTFAAGSRPRRSSQTAIYGIFSTLVRLMAPVATFTADEAWSFGVHSTEYADDSIHLQGWPEVPASWRAAELAAEFDQLISFRSRINEKLEGLRQSGEIGKGLDAAVQLSGGSEDPFFALLERHRDSLPELFIVSRVDLVAGTGPVSIVTTVAGGERCPRCWRWLPVLSPTPSHGSVCPRCVEALPH
jgi:isoleucyl-tRNA synthetase